MQATVIKAEYRVSTEAFAQPDKTTGRPTDRQTNRIHMEKKGERDGSDRKIYRYTDR